jgi:hypothetical protein
MGDHGAVADVGETLVELLRDRMTDLVSDDQIVLASPVDEDLKSKVRLTLFLFEIEGNTPHSTAERPRSTNGTPMRTPLRLDLKYLLTALPVGGNGSTTPTAKSMNEHEVLGRAMQVLRDNGIVTGPDLRGSLKTDDERLHVSMLPNTADSVMNLWNTFQDEPYHPSVAYLVTPVEIESHQEVPANRVEQFQIEEHVRRGGEDG